MLPRNRRMERCICFLRNRELYFSSRTRIPVGGRRARCDQTEGSSETHDIGPHQVQAEACPETAYLVLYPPRRILLALQRVCAISSPFCGLGMSFA